MQTAININVFWGSFGHAKLDHNLVRLGSASLKVVLDDFVHKV